MALRYTGNSDVFVHDGRVYARDPEKYARETGTKPYGGFDKPIVGLTEASALHLIQHTGNMHSFDVTPGEDLLEHVTAPAPTPAAKDK